MASTWCVVVWSLIHTFCIVFSPLNMKYSVLDGIALGLLISLHLLSNLVLNKL